MRPSLLLPWSLICCAAAIGQTLDNAEWRDVAARIEFGFYSGDVRVIEGTLPELAGAKHATEARFLQALASYRLAQIGAHTSAAGAAIERCLAHAEMAAMDSAFTAEAFVLVAACSQLASRREPLKARWHQRRARHALERVGVSDGNNPRLALVDGQRLLEESPERALVRLADAQRGFAIELDAGRPLWGYAEAHATLAAAYLAAGRSREARDLAEQALLIAPEYVLARAVREKVLSAQSRAPESRHE
jgi:tetratricopeptide (TPR) repeat protein